MRLRRIAKERRLAWARFGEVNTDVDVLDLFPSDEEYDAEYKAELEWWRSLDEMKERVEHYEKIKNEQKQKLDAQIESGLSSKIFFCDKSAIYYESLTQQKCF